MVDFESLIDQPTSVLELSTTWSISQQRNKSQSRQERSSTLLSDCYLDYLLTNKRVDLLRVSQITWPHAPSHLLLRTTVWNNTVAKHCYNTESGRTHECYIVNMLVYHFEYMVAASILKSKSPQPINRSLGIIQTYFTKPGRRKLSKLGNKEPYGSMLCTFCTGLFANLSEEISYGNEVAGAKGFLLPLFGDTCSDSEVCSFCLMIAHYTGTAALNKLRAILRTSHATENTAVKIGWNLASQKVLANRGYHLRIELFQASLSYNLAYIHMWLYPAAGGFKMTHFSLIEICYIKQKPFGSNNTIYSGLRTITVVLRVWK